MAESILDRIRQLLHSHEIEFREVHHEATRTSEESAKAHGESIAIGGKALLMKVGEEYKLFVLSASKRIDSQRIKEHFEARKLRFATTQELHTLTGLIPGSVPPFGKPILPFDLFVDKSIASNEKIAFNAGSPTDSIIMNSRDYLNVASPGIFDFSI